MTQFIHLSDARLIAAIRRNGIKAGAVRDGELRGFYCTPVTRSVYRTHQWLRELKRWGGQIVGGRAVLPAAARAGARRSLER